MHGHKPITQCSCDLLINIGKIDDRITGKIDEFSPNQKVHIDIDPSSINKIIKVDLAIVGDKDVIKSTTKTLKKKYKFRKIK